MRDHWANAPEDAIPKSFAKFGRNGLLAVPDPRRAIDQFVALTLLLALNNMDQLAPTDSSRVHQIVLEGVRTFFRANTPNRKPWPSLDVGQRPGHKWSASWCLRHTGRSTGLFAAPVTSPYAVDFSEDSVSDTAAQLPDPADSTGVGMPRTYGWRRGGLAVDTCSGSVMTVLLVCAWHRRVPNPLDNPAAPVQTRARVHVTNRRSCMLCRDPRCKADERISGKPPRSGRVRIALGGADNNLPSARPSPTRARAAGSSSRVKVRSMWIRTSPATQRSATGSKWAGTSFAASAPVWGSRRDAQPVVQRRGALHPRRRRLRSGGALGT
jgi:hypothetical protein